MARSVYWGIEGADPLFERVRREYRELPTLNLTFGQACRLWQLAPAECNGVLERLVADGFLSRTDDGHFVACPKPETWRVGPPANTAIVAATPRPSRSRRVM